MHEGKSVSICFPAFNEEDNITKAIEDFMEVGVVDEVIVADNGSTDQTTRFARKAGAKVVFETRRGYGYACRKAMNEAKGDIIVLSEPDGTFSGKDVKKLLAYIDDFDLVLGTRTSKELIWEGSNMGWFLKWGNWVLAKFIELLYSGPSLTDVGCTMRAIRKSALTQISDEFSVGGSHFSPEMTILTLKGGLRVIEVPINYLPRVGFSKITGNKWKAFEVGLAMLGLIFRNLF